MRNAATLLAALLLTETSCGEPIKRWDATHVKALKHDGVITRAGPRKEKKQPIKSDRPKKEKKKSKSFTPKKSAKKAKSHKGDLHVLAPGNSVIDVSSGECSGQVLGIAPETYCVEWIPGIGYSQECSSSDTEQRGGEVCNIVSKAWLRALTKDGHNVDIVLNHAGLCRADILKGAVTEDVVEDILPEGYSVVHVEMTGADIKAVLQQAAEAAYDGKPKAYPYGSGIRFKVDYDDRSKDDGFVYDIQVKPGFKGGAEDWHDIDTSKIYLVAANSRIVGGGKGYDRFANIPGDKKTQLGYTDAELFVHYLERKCLLEGAPYSTMAFDGLDELISGAYSCLEDQSLCECGKC